MRIVMRAQRADAPAEGEAPAAEGRTTVIASTADTDRMGDIVDQASWKLDGYRQNPVILWAHDASLPPVGRAVDIGVRDGRLMATIEWDRGHDLGATVARQFAEGFLSAVSVGFRPGRTMMAGELPEGDARRMSLGKYGVVYLDNELLEVSAVPVPANGAALAQRNAEMITRGLPAVGEDSDTATVIEVVERLQHRIAAQLAGLPEIVREAVRSEAATIAAEVLAAQLEADVDTEPEADPAPDAVARAWDGWPVPPDPWADWRP